MLKKSIVPTCITCGGSPKRYMQHEAVGLFWKCKCGLIFQDPQDFISEEEGLKAIAEGGTETANDRFQSAFSESIDTSDADGNMYSDHGIDHAKMSAGICDAAVAAFENEGKRVEGQFSWLDIGCANGFLLGELKRRFPNANLVGVEPSPVSAEKAKRMFGLDIHVGTMNTFQPTSETAFNFVTILGNLQLHENPFETVRKAAQLMKPGSLLVCQFKNPDCSARRLGRWASYVPIIKRSSLTKQIFERGFACMRYSGSKAVLAKAIERTGLRVKRVYSIAPRMLAWTDGSKAHAAGLKGKLWAVLDRLDQMMDQRAWIEFVCQKPE
ncbi:MAG: class I SAM-dependent methyltransferase [Pirellulales bacterium]